MVLSWHIPQYFPATVSIAGVTTIAATGGVLVMLVVTVCVVYRNRLRASLLQDLFESQPFGSVVTDIDDRVIHINTEFGNLFGYNAQEAEGRTLAELIVPAEAQNEYRKYRELVAQGRRVDAEITCCRRDDRRFPAAIALVPFALPGEKASVYLNFRDITERRRAEDSRWASENRWRAVFESSAVGISVTDTQGRFIATNRAYQEMVGYTDEELRSITYIELTNEEDRPRNAALSAKHWAGELERYQMEKRYTRKDGRLVWAKITVSKSGGAGTTPPFGVCVVEDITERKAAEDRLREYEKIVEGLQEMILVIDRQYVYQIANRAYLKYRDLELHQVVGHTVPELVGEDLFRKIVKARMDECFKGKVVRYEISVSYPTLGAREILATYFPIEGERGIDRIAVVLEDITDRKRDELALQHWVEELHALNAQLQNVREDERTRVARELHDRLGQALTAIKMDLASLKSTDGLDAVSGKITSMMAFVDETIRSVRRISTELRPAVLDDLGLAATVEWATEEFQARTGIECRLRVPEMQLEADGERATALFRILQEALTNVARHAGATGVQVELREEEEYLVMEVRDNGCGIGRAQISAVGSLGLLGMRERAVLLGGQFSIEGVPGRGTTVHVRLPARRQAGTR